MTHGIHLVWTTYGTWLPGDDRGHWSPLFDHYGTIIEKGGKLNVPDGETKARSRAALTEPPKWLTEEEIAVVAEEMGRLVAATEAEVWAAAIEANHVHVLIGPVAEDIARFIGRMKGRTSSVVGAMAGNTNRRRVWGDGYWKVFLFDDTAVDAVERYIDAHNERRGLRPSPYPWITSRSATPSTSRAVRG